MADTLKSLVDPGVQAQVDKLVESLSKALELVQKTNAQPLGVKVNGSGVSAQKKAVDDLAVSNNKLAISAAKVAEAQAKAEQAAIRTATAQARLEAVTTRTAQADAKASAAKKKALEDEQDEYKQLVKAYNEAAAAAKRLQAANPNSNEAQQAALKAKELIEQIKGIDASVGQYQKNVGNYSNAIADGFGKAFGFLRTAANILPGLGLSGLFLGIFEGIKFAGEALGLFNNKLFDTARQREVLNELTKESSKLAGKESADLKILKAEIENTNLPMKTRLQSIKDIKEEFPSYFDGLKDEDLLVGNVGNAYEKAAQAILQKARAQAAATQIEKIETEKLAILQRSQEGQKGLSNAVKTGQIKEGFGKSKEQRIAELVAIQDAQRQVDQERIDQLNKEEQFLMKAVLDGAEAKKNLEKKTGKERVEIAKESTKELLDREFELYKISQAERIKLLDEFSKAEGLNLAQRLQFITLHTQAKNELITRQAEDEIRKQNELEAALQANLKKSKDNEKKNILIELKNVETERLKIVANANVAIAENERIATTEVSRLKEEAYQKQLADAKAYHDALIKSQQDANALDESSRIRQQAYAMDELNKSYLSGALSVEAYVKAKKKLEDAQAIQSLSEQIDAQYKLAKVFDVGSMERQKALEKAAVLEKQLSDKKKEISNTEKKDKEKNVDKWLGIEQKAAEVTVAIVDGAYERRKNAIQKEIDLVQQRQEADVAAVNASTLNQQQKAAQLLIIEQTANAQKQKLQREQRQEEIRKAKFDKEAAIFQASLALIVSVIKDGIFSPKGIAEQIAGLALIGTLAAKEIPKYADGLESAASDHLGIYGEAGAELVTKPGQAPYIADKATLDYLPKGTSIKPLKDIENMRVRNMLNTGLNTPQQFEDKTLELQMLYALKEVKQAIKTQRQPTTVININSEWNAYIDKNVRN
jgi:hypothetical protein